MTIKTYTGLPHQTLIIAAGTPAHKRLLALITGGFLDPLKTDQKILEESSPVLEDEPLDPEVEIEQLKARIFELEAELEEHRRSVSSVIDALVPLGAVETEEVEPTTQEVLTGSRTAYRPYGDY